MEQGKPPWKITNSILICSFFDLAFGVFLIIIYLYKIIALKQYLEIAVDANVADSGIYNMIVKSTNTIFMLVINFFQVFCAGKLFINLIKKNADLLTCHRNSSTWLQVSKPLFLLLSVKFFFVIIYSFIHPLRREEGETSSTYYYVSSFPTITPLTTFYISLILKILVIVEWIFKLFALYFIQRFMNDLDQVVIYNYRFSNLFLNYAATTATTSGDAVATATVNAKDVPPYYRRQSHRDAHHPQTIYIIPVSSVSPSTSELTTHL